MSVRRPVSLAPAAAALLAGSLVFGIPALAWAGAKESPKAPPPKTSAIDLVLVDTGIDGKVSLSDEILSEAMDSPTFDQYESNNPKLDTLPPKVGSGSGPKGDSPKDDGPKGGDGPKGDSGCAAAPSDPKGGPKDPKGDADPKESPKAGSDPKLGSADDGCAPPPVDEPTPCVPTGKPSKPAKPAQPAPAPPAPAQPAPADPAPANPAPAEPEQPPAGMPGDGVGGGAPPAGNDGPPVGAPPAPPVLVAYRSAPSTDCGEVPGGGGPNAPENPGGGGGNNGGPGPAPEPLHSAPTAVGGGGGPEGALPYTGLRIGWVIMFGFGLVLTGVAVYLRGRLVAGSLPSGGAAHRG